MTHDVALLLVGAASGVVVAFFGGALSFLSTTSTQQTQHTHDLAVQGKQIAADREARREEAARSVRRQNLQPVFAVIEEMEHFLAYKFWASNMDESRDEISRAVLQPLVGDRNVTDAWNLARERIMKGVEYEQQWNSIVPRTIMASVRITDRSLRTELMAFSVAIQHVEFDFPQGVVKLGELHDRIEAYCATI